MKLEKLGYPKALKVRIIRVVHPRKLTNDNGKIQPFEDVSPIKIW